MTISLLVAAAENNAIGKNNQLLWSLPNDMKFFKNTTWGMAVVMGRKTYESVDKPLPGRYNIVITRQAEWKKESVIVATDLQDALKKAAETNCNEVFIIGGGEIYKWAIEIADKILITRVHASFDDADTFFPEIDESKWELIKNQDFGVDEKHKYAYSFQTWSKIPNS
jgi:dihydrofolate reductase